MLINAGDGVEKKGTLLHCWWECKLVQPLWRTVWRFLKKLRIELPYDPAILLLGLDPEETKIERDTCIPLFIAALFTIARTWKQLRCPSTNAWIKKLWYIYTMEYYSAIKGMHLSRFWWGRWTRTYYTQWRETKKERWILYSNIYMESRKIVLENLLAGQQWRNRHRE